VENIPDLLKTAYDLAQPEWDSGVTAVMTEATSQVIDVLTRVWVQLAVWYPPNNFSKLPSQYISDYVAGRFDLRYTLIEPEGPGTRGTIAHPMVAHAVLLDVQEVVIMTVESLLLFHKWSESPIRFEFEDWEKRMRAVDGSSHGGPSAAEK
jgi:hypothetical protein